MMKRRGRQGPNANLVKTLVFFFLESEVSLCSFSPCADFFFEDIPSVFMQDVGACIFICSVFDRFWYYSNTVSIK